MQNRAKMAAIIDIVFTFYSLNSTIQNRDGFKGGFEHRWNPLGSPCGLRPEEICNCLFLN